MNTKRNCSGLRLIFALTLLTLTTGCGITQGKLLWAFGFGQHLKEDAEFKLTSKAPVLVLVDDPEARLYTPATRKELALKVGKKLTLEKAVKHLVPQARLDRLRRQNRNFEEISCRELGEKAEAEQVVWLEVRDLYAEPEVDDTVAAARMTITVKVVNVMATEASEVRLWPTERQGRMVSVELHANDVIRAKKPEMISYMLTDKVAMEVVKLFYDHPFEDG